MNRPSFNRGLFQHSRIEGWLSVYEADTQILHKGKVLHWSPSYCVLQQDEKFFTAYCSEEISNSYHMDYAPAECARVRLDKVRRSSKTIWDGPPTLREENEEHDACALNFTLNTTLQSDLGEHKSKTLPRNNCKTEPIISDLSEDTSYEKACRRGSAPATPILGQKQIQPESTSTSKFTNFFSKRSNPLKRTKSVTKLERTKRGTGGGLRGSRSHESLLSNHAVMSSIDLSGTGVMGITPVHQSVLGRKYCFKVRGGPHGDSFYSCSSRQERDLWIYSLRQSIDPDGENVRHTDNSIKIWIYEAKNLQPKKKYFCELQLDKVLYGRTSVKLQTDLLFWGEYFDFPDIPDINVITVNVYREVEKKKKRDKHTFVGSVKIPIHEVRSRLFSENWYQILSEKYDSFNRNSKETIPTLRIKCRFQSIDILPISVYSRFLAYLKENYKKICEILEPVIGVKAKEDIGQALILLMHSQGLASSFLTDVVALDLLRVDDQRLTFRGNSLATKSMEAFLKLTGEQYLQDTLSTPINEIIQSDHDCEVDPTKASGSLQRQQASLRAAVHRAWQCIYESHKQFPLQLRICFATFRDRLQQLGRSEMADNLISASIFLRFLCPAILSPSLFNITNELPSNRATRNLTLVAKTLQTLANFTRFQGKESFMEFLNDFLEHEAPRMKEFLHIISMRPEDNMPDSVLEWAGYIDQGKQLSILHTLLSESIPKLSDSLRSELGNLEQILQEITQAKESNNFTQYGTNMQNDNQENMSPKESEPIEQRPVVLTQPQHAVAFKSVPPERGIIRGVLTQTALEKNIFRYNDPTVSAVVNRSPFNVKPNRINLDHSNSHNISDSQNFNMSVPRTKSQNSVSSSNNGSYGALISMPQNQSTVNGSDSNNPNSASNINGIYYQPSSSDNLSRKDNHYNMNDNNDQSSSNINRAKTLPRVNNNYDENCGEFIQISGLDTSSAFVRKSPTPMMKSNSNVVNLSQQQNNHHQASNIHNSSMDLSYRDIAPVKLNLGIPDQSQSNKIELYQRGIAQNDYNSNSNMPMNLEDLDDLFKYAEEHAVIGEVISVAQPKTKQSSIPNSKSKEQLSYKGSHCSSGYQSISTNASPTQSSSPIEKRLNQKFVAINNAPLAFKNPSYQLQSNHSHCGSSQQHFYPHQRAEKSSDYHKINPPVMNRQKLVLADRKNIIGVKALTPSSSDERLSLENGPMTSRNASLKLAKSSSFYPLQSNCSISGANSASSNMEDKNDYKIRNQSESVQMNYQGNRSLLTDSSSRSYGPKAFKKRLCKVYNKVEDNQNTVFDNETLNRRLSIESTRTYSDSSTDTEGRFSPHEQKLSAEGAGIAGKSNFDQSGEIQFLQETLDTLRSTLDRDEADLRDSNDDLFTKNHDNSKGDISGRVHNMSLESESTMRSIIDRLITMEEELRREQLKMSLALSHKQRVIEEQGQQIEALANSNNRLLCALTTLRQRYETQQHQHQSLENMNVEQ